MPQYVVKTAFKVDDKFTKAFRKLSPTMKAFGKQSEQSFKKASKAASNFGSIVKGILVAGAIQRSTALLSEGMRIAARDFATLDDAAMGATVRFSDMSVEGEKLWENLTKVKNVAREMGRTTEQTAVAAAIGLDFFARAGFDSATAFGLIKPTIDLATSAGEDFALVTDWVTDLLGSFALNVGTSTEKIQNFTRLTDVLVAAASSANVTIETMFETFKQAGPVGTAYGATLEEIAAMTAVLGSNSLKGEMAATALKNIFVRLSAPTYEVLQGFRSLGIVQKDLLDIKGAGKPIIEVFDILNDRMKNLTRSDRLAAMKKIGGLRAVAAFSILLRERREVERLNKAYLDAAGTNKKYADIMRLSLGNQTKLLTSALSALGDQFYEVFEEDMRRIFPQVIRYFQELNIEPFARSIRNLFIFVNRYKDVFKIAGIGLVSFMVVAHAGKILAFAKAITVLTGVLFGLNAVIFSNPVLLGIAATLTGVATGYAYRKEIAGWFTGGKPTAGTVDVNFNNVPPGITVETAGTIPGELTIDKGAMGVTP
jgi:TP901 family phage tail tape measure protein